MILYKHVCLSKYIGKTIFVDFSIFYGILFQPKRPSFKPLKDFCLASAGRPDGRPQPEVGRPSRSTDVHRRARPCLAGGPVDRPGRPSRELCSLERPRSTGRSTGRRDLLSVSWPRSTDRVDRWLNGLKYDRWPVDRAVDRQACQTPTASFSSPINLGVWALFFTKILGEL